MFCVPFLEFLFYEAQRNNLNEAIVIDTMEVKLKYVNCNELKC